MKLSVSIVTYQQIDYVAQTLEGVLRQETCFPFEIIVGDDASTDGTQEVLQAIQGRAQVPMKLLLALSNYGDNGLTNFMSTLDAADGEYIALLDGDDLWTAADKLQRQVDFLDRHPDCDLCVHRVEHVYEDGFGQLSARPGPTGLYDIGELLVENFAPKSATVVRRSAVDALPEWYRSTPLACADLVFAVLAARNGRVGFIDRAMAEHRLHSASLTNRYGIIRMLSDKIGAFDALRPYLPDHEPALARAVRRVRWKLRLARLGPRAYRLIQRTSARLTGKRPARASL